MITEDHLRRTKAKDTTKTRITKQDDNTTIRLNDAKIIGRTQDGLTITEANPAVIYGMLKTTADVYPVVLAPQKPDVTVIQYEADQTVHAEHTVTPKHPVPTYTHEQLQTYLGEPRSQRLKNGVTHVLINTAADDHQPATTRHRIGITPSAFYKTHELYDNPTPNKRPQRPIQAATNPTDTPTTPKPHGTTTQNPPSIDALLNTK